MKKSIKTAFLGALLAVGCGVPEYAGANYVTDDIKGNTDSSETSGNDSTGVDTLEGNSGSGTTAATGVSDSNSGTGVSDTDSSADSSAGSLTGDTDSATDGASTDTGNDTDMTSGSSSDTAANDTDFDEDQVAHDFKMCVWKGEDFVDGGAPGLDMWGMYPTYHGVEDNVHNITFAGEGALTSVFMAVTFQPTCAFIGETPTVIPDGNEAADSAKTIIGNCLETICSTL